MQWDLWYELAVLEMSELSDPTKEKRVEPEKCQAVCAPAAEESAEVEPATPA